MTSVLRSAPAAPMLTSFTIQATLSPPHRSTSRKVPSWTCTPNLAAVPQPHLGLAQHVGDDQPGGLVPAIDAPDREPGVAHGRRCVGSAGIIAAVLRIPAALLRRIDGRWSRGVIGRRRHE